MISDSNLGNTPLQFLSGRGSMPAELFGAKWLMTLIAHQFHVQKGNAVSNALSVCFMLYYHSSYEFLKYFCVSSISWDILKQCEFVYLCECVNFFLQRQMYRKHWHSFTVASCFTLDLGVLFLCFEQLSDPKPWMYATSRIQMKKNYVLMPFSSFSCLK